MLRLPLRLLLRCVACDQAGPGPGSPLCALCFESLKPAPGLCASCGSPACLTQASGACLRPWHSTGELASYHAAYLLLGRGHAVLRTWKKRRGKSLNRELLRLPPSVRERLQALGLSAITPIPQRGRRSWSMGGSPADLLAQWLSRELGVPRRRWLGWTGPAADSEELRQAERSGELRLQSRLRYQASEDARAAGRTAMSGGKTPMKILLVDDFMTSGHTLRAAARALRIPGTGGGLLGELHAFSLAARPMRLGELEPR